ncbi:exodeoxyribonuclease III [candidate division KSB3 bacterium]|uniref:Exodeoxyribonuclease III n=1 Tax=candidate division KSB3 bacterium TaxID=2044937 RepID=A0A2G6E644_9BACT|nr:MAG: exodeoxyribonuclease III [candidate division KSB3 bacterium]PIE29767.1 MAG: exodeoxyribonuclease III [candidate division KSB3 bacterium]
MKRTQRLISWNVNGIRALQRKGAFAWLLQDQADIVCLQETKAHPGQLNCELTEVEGYHVYFSSAERKGYSGVALYSKKEPKQVYDGFGIERFDREGRTLAAVYDDFILLNVYFPNGQASDERLQYKMDFYDAFLKYADTLKESGKNVIICGDVNTAHKAIDLARPKANETTSGFLPQERAWIDSLLAHGWLDTFRLFHTDAEHYTWWSMRTRARERNVGWRIDYFFVNEHFRHRLKDAFILADITGSDHCPLGIEIS